MANQLRENQSRDNQRKRIYDSEHEAFEKGRFKTDELKDLSVAECQAYVDKVCESKWFIRRYGRPLQIEVRPGKGHRSATADPDRMVMQLPLWSRKPSVMLHELAHFVIDEMYYVRDLGFGAMPAWHGPEFAKEFLALVQRFMGKEEADALRTAYKNKRVKYRSRY